MAPRSFLDVTTFSPERDAPGSARGRFHADWYQGRGAFGGVVAGALLRSMGAAAGDVAARPVRSFTAHFCAPASEGEVRLQTRVERAGKLVTHTTARLEGADGGTIAVATATFGLSRPDAPAYLEARRPQVPAPADALAIPADVPLLPTFAQHFEYRWCYGTPPYGGGTEAGHGAWVRPRVPVPVDAPLVVGLLDSMAPSVLSRVSDFRVSASVDFTVHFFGPVPHDVAPDAWWLRTARSRWAGDGFAEDLQELWTEDGRLVAQCRQLQAVLGGAGAPA